MDSMTTTTLTAQDVRALRHADAICFDHLPDGTGRIRAIVRADRSPTGFEQTHVISCEGRVYNYDAQQPASPSYTGFHMAMFAKHDDAARTLISRLRAGNTVTLKWVRGNASPVSREIGFVRDELRLCTGKPGKPAETYLVAVYTGYDNTARMVKFA